MKCLLNPSNLKLKAISANLEPIYKASFGVITPFFCINYATFLRTNLRVEINAKINAKKHLFA